MRIVQSRAAFSIVLSATCLLAPSLIGWCGFAGLVEAGRRERNPASNGQSSIKSPNPEAAPAYYLGPIEALVYVDPRWAALGWLWLLPGLAAGIAVAAWTTLRSPPPIAVAAASSAAGALLAAPWIFVITRMLMR
jgi:hypothetical protein